MSGWTLPGTSLQREIPIHRDLQLEYPPTPLALSESRNVGLVRLRLRLALAATFAIPVAVELALVFDGLPGFSRSPFTPMIAVLGLTAIMALLIVKIAQRVLEPARLLDASLMILEAAYDEARSQPLLDGLTGLGNHGAFQDELDRQWSVAARYDRPFALVLFDLDDFKQFNEAHGYADGDGLLRATGAIIRASLRRGDRAFRIGGDEFAMILPDTNGDGAYIVTRRLLGMCLDRSTRADPGAAISFSAGITAIPGPATDRETLYRHADAALCWSKRHGRTCATVFDPERHPSAASDTRPAELSARVARVAAQSLVRAVFQPIYDLTDGTPRGYEGLVRTLPDSGFSDPGTLFAAAEAIGRTAELDIACLETVMSAAASQNLPGSLSVNLSPRTLETDEFNVQTLIRMAASHGIAPDRIVVELTEREAVENLDRVREAAAACRKMGIRLAADDVGAGNAGLRLLSQLRFDIVKIDLSLVQGGGGQNESLEIVRTLRDLADRWGALVVAEGIETPDHLRVVRSLGIGAGQGYLLGRPTEFPPSSAIDLDELGESRDWFLRSLGAVASFG